MRFVITVILYGVLRLAEGIYIIAYSKLNYRLYFECLVDHSCTSGKRQSALG
jgi:hypothetical protein